jgi:hypothetical protein
MLVRLLVAKAKFLSQGKTWVANERPMPKEIAQACGRRFRLVHMTP